MMKSFNRNLRTCSVATLLLVSFATSNSSRPVTKDLGTSSVGVLLGPQGSPAAQGPTGTDDDFTNLSMPIGVTTPAGTTSASSTVVFRNMVQNIGARDDAFIITVPSVPAGFRVEISSDFGDHYFAVDSENYGTTLPVAYHASSTFMVRITAPPGLAVLSSYDTLIRATSTLDPAVFNETIDRLYSGFVRLENTARLVSVTGAGDIGHAGPGSEIEFAVTYTNISTAQGSGNALLTAYNLVINEDGNAAPNNWGATTDHIVGASDNQGGYIIGDREGSTALSDIITKLAPGDSGVFKFRRRIK